MKKFLLTLIVLLISAVPKLSADDFEKVTDLSSLKAGDEIIFIGNQAYAGKTKTFNNVAAHPATITDAKNFSSILIGQANDPAIGDKYTVSADELSKYALITVEESGIANYPLYLTITDSSVKYYITSTATSSANTLKFVTKPTEKSQFRIGSNGFEVNNTTKPDLLVSQANGTSGISTYSFYNKSTSNVYPTIYRKVSAGAVDADVTAAPISVVKGGSADIVLLGVPDVADLGELSYSVAEGSESYVSVSEDGVVTGLAETTEPATVNITWTGSEKYNPGQTTCAVTVTDPNYIGTITFDPASGSELTFGQKVTISCPGATNITWMGGENIMGEVNADRAEVAITEACTLEVVATNAAGITAEAKATYTIKAADVYDKVLSTAELDFSLPVLLVCEKDSVALSSTSSTNKNRLYTEIKISDGTTTITSEKVSPITFEVADAANGYYYLTVTDDGVKKYLVSQSSNGLLTKDNSTDEYANWTISVSDGTATIQCTNGNRIIKYNNSNKIFSAYASGQQPIAIYQLRVNRGPVDAKVEVKEVELNRTQTAKVELTGLDGTRIDRLGALSYTVDEECKDIISIDADGNITPLAVGVAMYTVAWEASTFYTAGEELGMVTVSKVPVPAAPVFSVASGEVAFGTALTITCEGAETLNYMIGETMVENATLPVELTITDACDIIATGVSIDGDEGASAEASYTIKKFRRFAPVTSIDDLNEETDYLVVGYIKSSNTYRAMGAYNSDNYMEAKEAEAVNGGINEPAGAVMMRIVKNTDGTVSFVVDGKYLAAAETKNKLEVVETVNAASSLTLTINKDKTISAKTTVNSEDRVLQFNNSNPRFSFYKTTSGMTDFYICAPLSNKHAVLSMVQVGDPNEWNHIANNSDLLVNTTEAEVSFIVAAETGYTVHFCNHREGDAIVPEQPSEPGEPEQPAEPASVMRRADHADDAAHTWTTVGDDNLITIPTGSGTLYLTTHNGVEYAEPKAITYNIGANVQTGVEGVSVSTAEVVEWYTLEGIRVAEPAAGRVYIRRTSTGATRVLVR